MGVFIVLFTSIGSDDRVRADKERHKEDTCVRVCIRNRDRIPRLLMIDGCCPFRLGSRVKLVCSRNRRGLAGPYVTSTLRVGIRGE